MLANPHPNAKHVAVVPCQDPQLVVVRGLLLDQQQKMETGYLSVLASRVARASYGVIVKEHYVAERHFNEELVEDPNDSRRKWAINQIQWLIKKVRDRILLTTERADKRTNSSTGRRNQSQQLARQNSGNASSKWRYYS